MNKVYFIADNIISSLGFTTSENIDAIEKQITGINKISDKTLYQQPFYASQIKNVFLCNEFSKLSDYKEYTKFEKMCILSITDAINKIDIEFTTPDTLFILSTTKGNIDLLNLNCCPTVSRERAYLWKTAEIIKNYFNFYNTPIVVSNACISGVIAIITASRLIEQGLYKNIIVCGADILTEFVISGFQSFMALSPQICKPFDINRNGLNLGEGCGTIILSNKPNKENNIIYCAGAITNDANHISGPSRTAEGLSIAINKAIKQSDTNLNENNCFVSAHGTATPYNDEMEAIAFERNKINNFPTVGLKGYFGHTLGAAGVIESIASIHSLKSNIIHSTLGFEEHGVSIPVNIVTKTTEKENEFCIKVASGFGGCNATAIFQKI
ncbi:MAG: hypothetical protein A2X08_04390 [Bacteroidetes bacterium GWA2_32_17]|nr:MAG: hypothetical protein A2X08_04390 [Bacteroidetes bacterium GWA2_32_17]